MTKYERLPSSTIAIVALLIIAATYVVNAMDRIVFPVLLHTVDHEYGFTLAQGGFLATIFTLGLGVAGVPSGFLFDRMSRKTVAVVGIVIYSVCTILTAVSIGFYDMAAYRAISGVGEALQNAAIFTAAGAYFSRNRTLALGVLNVAYGLGSFIGPRWGAHILATTGSWREPLYLYGIIGLVGALVVMLVIPKGFTEQHFEEVSGQAASEEHIPDRLINRNTVIIGIAAICGGVASFGYLGLYPTFLRTQLNFSLPQVGTAASMFGAGAIMGLLCGYLGDRVNQKWLNFVTLIVLGIVGYALFNVAKTPLSQDILSFLEGTASSGFLYVNDYSLMQRSVRSTIVGRASGLVVTCVYLPSALAGYLFALLVGKFGWGGAATLQQALLLIIPIVSMLFFDLSQTSCKVGGREAKPLRVAS